MNIPKVFLFCSERSGSNLITKLLNAHSSICGPSTKHLLNASLRNLHRYQEINEEKNWKDFVTHLMDLFHVDFSIWKSDFNSNELFDQVKQGDIQGLFNYIFDKETRFDGKKVTFIKEIKIYEIYPFITRYFSNPRFLYLVRDPRDMALSWKKSKIHKGGVVTAAKQWKNDQQQFLKCACLEQEKNTIYSLKYEDLISHSEEKIKEIFSFLDLPYEDVQSTFYKDETTVQNSEQNEAWKNLSGSIITDNSKKFLAELSSLEISLVEKICGDEMKVFNYNKTIDIQEIKALSGEEIEQFEKDDLTSLLYEPPKGVTENMKAKAQFYRR